MEGFTYGNTRAGGQPPSGYLAHSETRTEYASSDISFFLPGGIKNMDIAKLNVNSAHQSWPGIYVYVYTVYYIYIFKKKKHNTTNF